MTRQQANLKIAELLKGSVINHKYNFVDPFIELANRYPDQRAGQIFCNYICTDYRAPFPSLPTEEIMFSLFIPHRDPFFEESAVTLRRLEELCKR